MQLLFSNFFCDDLPSPAPHADVHKTINKRAFQGPTVHKWPWAKVKHILIEICVSIWSHCHSKHTHWTLFSKITMCYKQRWSSNPMGIMGILIFLHYLLVLIYCQGIWSFNPSCELLLFWKPNKMMRRCLFFFFFPRPIFKNATTATPCLYTCSHGILKHTDPQTHRHSSQIVRNSCHFQVPNQKYLSQTWQDSLFVSWACLLSSGRGSLRLL